MPSHDEGIMPAVYGASLQQHSPFGQIVLRNALSVRPQSFCSSAFQNGEIRSEFAADWIEHLVKSYVPSSSGNHK